MPNDLAHIDPTWAWSAYQPSAQRPWNRRLAAHLWRRAGFGASGIELDEAMKLGVDGAINRLCSPPPPGSDFLSTMALLSDRAGDTSDPNQLAAWWLYRILATRDPLLEKLTLFWHGHFATSNKKVSDSRMMLDQNELLRQHAGGKFESLVKVISRDPAMLIYLDSTNNRRIHPNENYARELMELFCLGVGNYTETDIKQVARAFTGWEVRSGQFMFNHVQHDTGVKSFLGQHGNFDGDDAIRIILQQPAAGRFIARKLVRFFVMDEPAASDALIEPLAAQLCENGFEIGPVVRRILSSNLFFSESAVGRKVRSPVEMGLNLLRAFGATTNLVSLAGGCAELGQALFYPPNVKGWDGGRAWINSSTLLGRANLVRQVLLASETKYRQSPSLAALADAAGAKGAEKTVDWLSELLLAVPLRAEGRKSLCALADGAKNGDANQRLVEVIQALSALPEFQLN